MLKWNRNEGAYVNAEGFVECNWGGNITEITYHRCENDCYFFREWDEDNRLVAMTQIPVSAISFAELIYKELIN